MLKSYIRHVLLQNVAKRFSSIANNIVRSDDIINVGNVINGNSVTCISKAKVLDNNMQSFIAYIIDNCEAYRDTISKSLDKINAGDIPQDMWYKLYTGNSFDSIPGVYAILVDDKDSNNKKIAGFTSLLLCEAGSPEDNKPPLLNLSMYLFPDYTKHGIGSCMQEHMIKKALKNNYRVMCLTNTKGGVGSTIKSMRNIDNVNMEVKTCADGYLCVIFRAVTEQELGTDHLVKFFDPLISLKNTRCAVNKNL